MKGGRDVPDRQHVTADEQLPKQQVAAAEQRSNRGPQQV
jgi:hypothetical protein